jgi:hypothetical protein
VAEEEKQQEEEEKQSALKNEIKQSFLLYLLYLLYLLTALNIIKKQYKEKIKSHRQIRKYLV